MSDDRLDRQRFADQVARVLRTVADQSDSSVVALVGPWGSGKTTLIDEVRTTLEASDWYTATHNPWSYSDYAGTVAGFFSAIRDAVPDEVLGKAWRESLGGWVSRAAPLGAAGGVVGIDGSSAVGLVGSLIAGDRSPQALRDEAITGLETLEHPVLIVLDDLDRLEPSELLFTFKLVRLLGRLPNVYYLIAYDEDTLVDILRRTNLVGSQPGRAQQYLEKMVQVRVDLPPLLIEQQLRLVNAGVDDLCETHGIHLTGEANVRLQQAWNECFVHYLDQPRSFKRLFTQVDAFWNEVAEEVDFVDFLLVTFLRTFEKSSFDLMVERRAELLGESLDFALRKETHAARWTRWLTMIGDRSARNPQAVAVLLSEMFLEQRSARENMSYSDSYKDDVRRRRGIGSSEYFDRYVQVGVPVDDLPDSLVAVAAAQLRAAAAGPELQQLENWLDQDAVKTARKLARVDQVDPLPPTETLEVLGRHYAQASDQQNGIFGRSGSHQILLLGRGILDRCDGPQGVAQLRALAEADASALRLAGDIVRRAKYSDDENASHPWLDEATGVVANSIELFLRNRADRPLDELSEIASYLWTYAHLAGEEAGRTLLWELLTVGSWQLVDLLGLLTPIGTTSTGRESWPSLGDFSSGDVDSLLGLDRVLAELGPALDGPVDYSDGWFERRTSGVDLESRKAYALASLKRIKKERETGLETPPRAAAQGDAGDRAPEASDEGDAPDASSKRGPARPTT